MGETPDQIRSEIEHTRYRLGQDLETLEQRVKQETDWRVQVRRHPWAFVGVVFALALIAGMALASTKKA